MRPDMSSLSVMDQLSDKKRKSAGVLLRHTLSAVVCLVGLTSPVVARLTAMAPPTAPAPPAQGPNNPKARQGSESPAGDQSRKELKEEVVPAADSPSQPGASGPTDKSLDRSSTKSDSINPGSSSIQKGGERKEKQVSGKESSSSLYLAGRLDPRWFLYGTLAIVALLALWLALLTWRSFRIMSLIHKKTARLQEEIRETQDFLNRLDGTLSKQATSHTKTKELAEKISVRLANQGDDILAIQRNLRYQDDRFLDFQTRQDEQIKGQVAQAQDESLIAINHPKSEMTDDQASSLNPGKLLASEYQEAFYRSDRTFLRRIITHELNITQTSEDILMKSAALPTQLEVVKTGGSYLLIQRDDKNWLVPDFQSLTSFTTNQLSKGIFTYIKEHISTAELREPAEVRECGFLWEVVSMGVIAVPF
jgi:cytoskeletal protein RodZ